MCSILSAFFSRAHSHEQTPVTMVLQCGTQLSTESTESMQVNCVAQGHSIQIELRIHRQSLYPETDFLT